VHKLRKLWQYRWFRLAVEVISILLLLLAVRAWMQRGMVAGPVPELEGRLLNDKPYSLLADSRRPLLVHFWASWCPVCKLEQESIQAISEDYPVITIAMQSGEANEVTEYMLQEGLRFPVINDSSGMLSRRFGVRAVPSSFIVSKNNTIVFREAGYTTGIGLRLRLWVAQYWR
jgi:thiol-disulfide isomerase/thioredoxin